MARSFSSAARRGLTLIELVVVVAILGVLAAMLLPKFEGLQSSANHAASASSASDAARLIGTYKTAKQVYPNGWDSLTDGTNLWTGTATTSSPAGADTTSGGNAGSFVNGLHPELVSPSNAKLQLMTITNSAQINALTSAGITSLFNVNTSLTGARAGDMFVTPVTISPTSTSLTVATIKPSATSGDGLYGSKIVNHIYRQNLLTGATTVGMLPSSTTALIAFGLGPHSALIPNSMLEAPTYGNANAQYVYNRLLVVFELATSSSGSYKVTFKGVFGADGDLLDDMADSLQTATSL